jgi:hypothetical protein
LRLLRELSGLGVHRRLNQEQAKQNQPELDYPDVSFWYLVNHLGERFLADLPRLLPGARKEEEGIWQAAVYGHPVLLVSVQELRVERDSMALHVLAGVPEAAKSTIVEVLKAEPALWPSYQPWLSLREPAIWQEISLMAAQQGQLAPLDLRPLAEYIKTTGDLSTLKSLLEAFGVKKTVEALGVEQIWAGLSPEQREELVRLAQNEKAGEPSNPG